MDKHTKELAEYYELEINEEPGCTIIDSNGNERSASAEDAVSIFGIGSIVEYDNYITCDTVEYKLYNKWVIVRESDNSIYLGQWLEVA
jgi:hypothetical protein